MNTKTRRRVALALPLCIGAASMAQDLMIKAPEQSRPIVIENAEIHTVSHGDIPRGGLLIVDGAIDRVWKGATPDLGAAYASAERIDASGLRCYPGLIGANTTTGLVEISAVRATLDYDEVGEMTPEVRAAVSVNPDSTIIPVTRLNGVLTVGVLPTGGVIPGRASLMRLDGWTWEDMTVEDDMGLMINWPSMRTSNSPWVRISEEEQRKNTRERLDKLDEFFAQARAYAAARQADPSIETDIRLESMAGVLSGAKPALISANELEQIEAAALWAEANDIRAIIVGGRDSWLCADLLKRLDIPVIITGTHHVPRRRDSAFDEAYTLPVKLERAGVRWCLATDGGPFQTPHERNLPYHAATAVAYGLDHDAAIRAITLAPAEILGAGDRLGSIDAGKSATLLLTDGDPLEETSTIALALIDGRRIDLESKQTILNEKYREKYDQLRRQRTR
ncbi:MAG: amidohydrolase family protein [Phycisphaeraceae bacterium]|nr:amidohydrolase family protein [Phycisphaeraceae bacterium]MCB9847825.1 amidohydrolase family protein [Phycisphaeraceae bacterium]